MITSIKKCEKFFNNLLPLMPAQSNMFARNTLILHLFMKFESCNQQFVWTQLQDNFSRGIVTMSNFTLLDNFCTHFKDACKKTSVGGQLGTARGASAGNSGQ